uniref:Uncharacterized protein n=1 Tax=Parastrongyloides trichosuri TaxID=131310 RepID=A0A0N4ZZ37_PARTI
MRVTCRWCKINNCKRFRCHKYERMNLLTNIVTEELPRTFRIPETLDIDEDDGAGTSNCSEIHVTSTRVYETKEISLYHQTPLRRPKIYKNFHNKEQIFIKNLRDGKNPGWLKRASLSTIRKTNNRGRNICVTLQKNCIENIFEFVRSETVLYDNNHSLYDIEEEFEMDGEENIKHHNDTKTQSPRIVELDDYGNEIVSDPDPLTTNIINNFSRVSLNDEKHLLWRNNHQNDCSNIVNEYENQLEFRENMLIYNLESLHIPEKKNGFLSNDKDIFESSIDAVSEELIKRLDMSQ